MAVYTGTSVGHKVLLVDFAAHAVTSGWTVLKTETLDDDDYLYLRGPDIPIGLSTTNVFLGIRTRTVVGSGIYNWELRGATGFNTNLPYDQQPGVSPAVWVTLYQNTIEYRMYVSDRRIVLIPKVTTVFANMYSGLLLPNGTPSEFPYPLYIGGNAGANLAFTTSNFRLGGFWDPPSGAARFRQTNGQWANVVNYSSSTGRDTSATTDDWNTWPYRYNEILSLQRAPDLSYSLMPIMLLNNITHGGDNFGEFEDVFFIPGVNNAVENTGTENTDQYYITQSSYRNTSRDFIAIKEV